jgi:hypothetical protein
VERLRTANLRLADAQLERMWAIKSSHEAGLSIRQIASATGLSASRVHQVVNSEEPVTIPVWVTDLGNPTEGQTPNRLVAEVEFLRQCVRWLHQLERVEDVIVNMMPDTERETEYVRFDRPRVIRAYSGRSGAAFRCDVGQYSAGKWGTFGLTQVLEQKRTLSPA